MTNKEQTASTTSSASSERNDDKRSDSTVAGKVHEAAEQVRDKTAQRVGTMRQSVDAMREQAAERVRKLGDAVRKMGEHMRIEDQTFIAEHATGASQRLDSVAGYIDEAELGTLWRDAEAVARKSPVLILGGTFLLGLAAGRFLKSPVDGEPESDDAPQLPATATASSATAAKTPASSVSNAAGPSPRRDRERNDQGAGAGR